MASVQLTREEALRYWDERHRREGDLRSGGHIGWDHATNEAFYIRRGALLLTLIGDRIGPFDAVFALDAGCGKGQFARMLTSCGLLVDGIDTSPEAIKYCQEHGGGVFSLSTLSAFRSPYLYDVVFSIDVLFHILEDEEWESSLRNLASLVHVAGRLIVADEASTTRRQAGNYIVHRPVSAYTDVLGPLGFRFEGFTPYAFRENAVGLLAFARVA
jgi:2-polyprenyl-3-methyl-5-hydroxy-6-metoxy-1,4-benzoquinol methylase